MPGGLRPIPRSRRAADRPLPHLLRIEALFPEPIWHFGQHVHDDHELVYIANGSYEVQVDGGRLTGGPGDMFYYPAGLPHEPRYPVGGGMMMIVCGWRESAREATRERPRTRHDASGRMLGALNWLIELWTADAAPVLCDRLLSLLLHAYHAGMPARDPDVIGRVRTYMRHNLHRPLDLDRLAEVAAISRFHFIRRFRAATGESPMRHLARLRVEAAQTLLFGSDLPMKAIARRVGIPDPAYLSRLIRRATGESPSALRRRQRARS